MIKGYKEIEKNSLKSLLRYFGYLVLILIVVWAAVGAQVNLTNIVTGFPNIIDYLSRMIPPDPSNLNKLSKPIAETFQIAIMSIIFSTIIAFPISFIAARNIMPNIIIYQTSRTILGILRGIPELVYAILFVAMVGLGPFAGVLALTFHCIGSLGRFFSEAIENINPEIINAAKATGANRIKIIIHAVIPELAALFVGYIIYYFEWCVRSSTALGLVGAGGIGQQLLVSIHLFKYREAAAIMLVIISIIVIIDRVSTIIRTKIIKGDISTPKKIINRFF